VLLYRRGRRAEALVIGAVAVAFVIYDAGFWGPFGGWGPGPRYLIPTLPFLAVPLALAWRRWPLMTGSLAVVSAGIMLAATATDPLIPYHPGRWWRLLVHGHFTRTLGLGIAPFALLVVAAVVLVVRATPRLSPGRHDAAGAAVALAGWLVVLRGAPALLRHGDLGAAGALGLALLVAAAVAAALAYVPVPRVRPSDVRS
jgi:hypothetical protein